MSMREDGEDTHNLSFSVFFLEVLLFWDVFGMSEALLVISF